MPSWETSAAGPFDHWPNNIGFEYFYGFVGGDCNQWNPPVFENNVPLEPSVGNPDYHLDADLADHAIHWIQTQKSLAPDKPFFVYYVPGATHAPHHVPKEWIEKFKGRFDLGWDVQREETHKRQLDLGVIPKDTGLNPRPDNIGGWDELDHDQKRVYSRMMEVYAAYLHFTDHNIGRVVDCIKDLGVYDNTLIIYIMGDNGGSGEGSLQGTTNEVAINGNKLDDPFQYLLDNIDNLGGPFAFTTRLL